MNFIFCKKNYCGSAMGYFCSLLNADIESLVNLKVYIFSFLQSRKHNGKRNLKLKKTHQSMY